MRKITVTGIATCATLFAAGGAWVGCTAILGDFSQGNASDAGSDVTSNGDVVVPVDGAKSDAPSTGDAGPSDGGGDACTTNCPGGSPCTSGTQCSSGTCTGNKCTTPDCAIDASCAPGTACLNGGTCGSGNCLDGVCCTSSACPACTNCGSTGACNVIVAGKDDTTSSTCSGNSTCIADGGCTPRWTQVGTSTTVAIPTGEFGYGVTAGDVFYFSSASGAAATGMEGFDTTNNSFAAYPKDESMCWCGGSPSLAGGVIGGKPYLFSLWDEQLDYWTPGATTWTTSTAHPTNDNATAGLLGSTVYSIAGTASSSATTATYGLAAPGGTTWSTLGTLPTGTNVTEGCAVSDPATGSIYLFGGQSQDMYVYSQTANTWAQIAIAAGSVPACYAGTPTLWQGKIALVPYEGTGIALFDIASSSWLQQLPLPSGTWQYGTAFSPANGGLYVFLFDGTNDVIFKWNLN